MEENKNNTELNEEQLEEVSGGFWSDCHDCPLYGRTRKCFEVKARGECPKGHEA